MARIGIDARFHGTYGKGLGRYTQKLIEKLQEFDSENQYFIFLRRENFDDFQPSNENFKKVLADYRWYSFSEQTFFPLLLLRYKLDMVHFPHFNVPLLYRKPIIVTIHDLILLHFPTLKATKLNPILYWLKFLAYKITIRSALFRSKRIITVSNFTKKDILKNYKINSDKIAVTYEACDDFCNLSRESQETILLKYGIIKPYILYVGNAYPHKNLERLIRSFKDVVEQRRDLKLVLVGKKDYFYEKLISEFSREEFCNVIFAGYVEEEDLDTLYRNAKLYVFPSLYEGFGLPPLEAMAKGLPVISSDHECMREVLGDSVLFIDATNERQMSENILELLDNHNLREELIRKGYARSASYSWKKMAKKTLNVYKNKVQKNKQ